MPDPPPTQIGPEKAPDDFVDLPVPPGYEILAELGRGGMGVVYRARDLASDRTVALKLVRSGPLAGPQERARFRLEADAAARLSHPGIVSVHDIGAHQGSPFLVMELIDGGSLHQLTGGDPQPARSAARLIQALALAIQHAHDLQIIHRDLKPANVLLARLTELSPSRGPNDEHDSALDQFHPKIADFGLAKRLDAEETALTQDGAVLGTASYMAPEQAAGRVQEVGPAADLYSLGAILYELLCGRPPFRGDSWNRTVEQVLNEEPLPPSRWKGDVPRDLESICLKCLEKDPLGRYASAGELAADLERFLDGREIAAVPLDEQERLRRLAARDGVRLVAEIGRGPGSTVYRALQGPLQQMVAVKVFAAEERREAGEGEPDREAWESRFRQSAEAWSVLSHPQVVLPQRSGWWDRRRYVVLDHAPNGSLMSLVSAARRPVRQVVEILLQLTEIVGYLHRQGVVHGNLKASNVLLAAGEIPRITDFHPMGGMAGRGETACGEASEGEEGSEAAAIYSAGALAPERLGDPARPLGLGADVYGLGVVLYELVAGRPPFVGGTVSETMARVREELPGPPSAFGREVPVELDRICLRCLLKVPARRFARVYELQTRLERLACEL
ncbi:serine/threonine-protein kinase [Planctomyces sp. SH-PL14]|uniref:serine/threonine-protein kinase n=1 Tax=Planctomyces sp. SH-PL14 TaxID=1632864 RepID=UPI00078C534E|nr:serine/threonine-protein kinase [Planctomyces sp. SH-PL14]AMV20695.1 Serine/threonine-protein kinase PknB [Planctomyces sp. SH-PL14]